MIRHNQPEDLRSLPAVHEVQQQLRHLQHIPASLLVEEIRAALAERRRAIREQIPYDAVPISEIVEQRLTRLLTRSLRRVINATGIVLHTNLGRAPLGDFRPISGYSNLEYDLETGKRSKRDVHTAVLLERLTGRASVVVNNNAAAVFLVLHQIAGLGGEVIVSRGELIEIGDGFRIPDIMAQSGAVLREVGATNRTKIDDYRRALTDRTRLILRVHRSNFQMSGFTAQPALEELCELGRQANVPVYEDLGSGCLIDLRSQGIHEPLVGDSFKAGADLVSFSTDKLLGGPQSGIIAGNPELVANIRRNPLYRALRCDKLAIEALSKTLMQLLQQNGEANPTLRMIQLSADDIRTRAKRLARKLRPLEVLIRPGFSAVGGGSTPNQTLPTFLVCLRVQQPNAFESKLRRAPVPVISRIEQDLITFDLRTVAPAEEQDLAAAIQFAAENQEPDGKADRRK